MQASRALSASHRTHISEEATQAWIEPWNPRYRITDLRVAGETQQWWWCSCRIHATLKTSQAVHRKKGPRLSCVRCSQLDMGKICKGTSKFELSAWQIVDQHQDMIACAEIKRLRGYYGAADIYIPFSKDGRCRADLIIQVDGQHHFEPKHQIIPRRSKEQQTAHWQKQLEEYEEQQRIDADFDQRCWELNVRLLRLHYKDTAAYSHLIKAAWQRCLASPNIRFQMFSVSYQNRPAKSAIFGEAPYDEEGKMNHKRKRGCITL